MTWTMRGEGLNLADLVPDSLLVRSLDGKVCAWNAGSQRLYGWTAEQAIGRNVDELLSSNHPFGLDYLLDAVRCEGHWHGEIYRRTADERDIRVRVRWNARRDESGAVAEIVEWGRDTEEGSASEVAAHRFTNLFHAMAASFWELDFSEVRKAIGGLVAGGITDIPSYLLSNADFIDRAIGMVRVIDVNEQTLELYRIPSREAVLSQPMDWTWPAESRHVFAESLIAAAQRRDSYSVETVLKKWDGEPFEVLFTVCWPSDHKAQGTVLVGIIDIAGRKRAETRLQEVQTNLSHAARVSTLGELTASIAHEVNQPLAAITAFGEASLRWLQRGKPDLGEVESLTREIISDARRASDIIARIRGMALKRDPNPLPLDIAEVIEEAMLIVRHEGQTKAIDIDIAVSDTLPRVLADKVQLQQVIVNLAINALQAIANVPAGRRRLTISATLMEAGQIEVRVDDSGPGIAVEHVDQLFNGFFTTKENGMGMGLAICRSIIQDHGGRIGAANHAGGARFYFTLPAAT